MRRATLCYIFAYLPNVWLNRKRAGFTYVSAFNTMKYLVAYIEELIACIEGT